MPSNFKFSHYYYYYFPCCLSFIVSSSVLTAATYRHVTRTSSLTPPINSDLIIIRPSPSCIFVSFLWIHPCTRSCLRRSRSEQAPELVLARRRSSYSVCLLVAFRNFIRVQIWPTICSLKDIVRHVAACRQWVARRKHYITRLTATDFMFGVRINAAGGKPTGSHVRCCLVSVCVCIKIACERGAQLRLAAAREKFNHHSRG